MLGRMHIPSQVLSRYKPMWLQRKDDPRYLLGHLSTKCPREDFESRLVLSGCSFADFKIVLLLIHTNMGMFDNSLIVLFSAQQIPSSYT